MRVLLRMLAPLGALILTACGSETVRLLEGTWPVAGAGRLELRELHIDVPPDSQKDARDAGSRLILQLRKGLGERLVGPDPVIILEPRIVEFWAEYSEPKLWGGGGGFVRGTVTLEVVFKSARGARLGAIRSIGTSRSYGWSVGSMAAAGRRAVDGVLDFVEDSIPRG